LNGAEQDGDSSPAHADRQQLRDQRNIAFVGLVLRASQSPAEIRMQCEKYQSGNTVIKGKNSFAYPANKPPHARIPPMLREPRIL